MNKSTAAAVLLSVLGAYGSAQPVWADSASATCEFYKHGDKKHDRWGACSFSQRQGYIDITLKDGSTYNLSPRDDANQYKDQEGNKVDRTQPSGNRQVYEWHNDQQKLVVVFNASAAGNTGGSQSSNVDVSGTPQDLKDLVNGQKVGGEVEDVLRSRGWSPGKSEEQGSEVYSYWSQGARCVVVHFNASRHVASIANAMESSCK